MIRTFIALDIPEDILAKIKKIADYFQTQTPPQALRWVAPQNMHLTIKFLGDIPEKKVNAIKSLINKALAKQPAFSITIEGLGMYPSAAKPRVIWLGISSNRTLFNIHDTLDNTLKQTGIKPEKRAYSPHLTIARVSRRVDRNTVKAIGKTLSQFKVNKIGKFTVNQIVLYKSDLRPQGPIHTPLLSTPLNTV